VTHLRSLLFVALAGSHALAAIVAPAALAPAVAGSIYLPLIPLKAAGIPVFAPAPSGGWSSPSPLGWVMVVLLWFAVWWAAAYLLSRPFSRRGGNVTGREDR
jgi:hypothetical protein